MLSDDEKRIHDLDPEQQKTRDTGRTTRKKIKYRNCDSSVPSLQFITETGLVPTALKHSDSFRNFGVTFEWNFTEHSTRQSRLSMQPHQCLQQLIIYVGFYGTLPYVTDLLLLFGSLRHLWFLLVAWLQFGAQGSCVEVMSLGLPNRHCIWIS